MKGIRPLCFAVVALALWWSPRSIVEAQPPVRIGASASRNGSYAALGQNQLRGYELCVRHTNDKGGLLGRKLELLVEDDHSAPATAARIYERLITQEKVDLVLGPYGSPMTVPVASITEKHRMPLVAPTIASTPFFKAGRQFIFMVFSPAEAYLEGFVELVARQGLKTLALIGEDSLFPQAAVKGAAEGPGREGSRWSSPRPTRGGTPISRRS